MQFILNRFKERTTWVAVLAPAMALFGYEINGAQAAAIGLGLSTLIGILLPDKK